MDATLYLIGQGIIILLVFGLLSSISFGLRFALAKIPMPAKKRKRLIGLVLIACLLWLFLLAILALGGVFRDFQSLPPKIFMAVLPTFLIIGLLLNARFFTLILKLIPEKWLVLIQSFRIFMELFLWMGFLGNYVPPQMTFAWLNFDIIVGITAIMGAYVFFRKGRYRRVEAIIWNVMGILLLINIVVIAIVSTPSPLRIFANEPANTFIAEFPFIWIPGFIVPFALAMHLFSLKQLIKFWKPSKSGKRF